MGQPAFEIVRNAIDLGFLAPKLLTILAHSMHAHASSQFHKMVHPDSQKNEDAEQNESYDSGIDTRTQIFYTVTKYKPTRYRPLPLLLIHNPK